MTTEAPEYGQYDYDEGGERTVRDYLAIARRRKWYIIVPVVVVVGASLAVSLSAVKMYRSQASVLVQAAPVPGTVMSESAMSPRTLNNELLRAQGVQLQAEARKITGPEPTLNVGLAQDKDADLFVFRATSNSPIDAADAANAYADVYVESRKAALAADFDSQAEVLIQQRDRAIDDLDAAGDSNSDAALEMRRTVADYQSKIDDVETAAKFAAESGAQIVNEAEVPAAPFSPQPVRDAILALLLGLFVGTIAAFARDTLDQRVRTVNDLERATDIPVLAVITRLKRWGKRSETHVVMLEDASSPQAESYRALRTKIQFRRVDHSLKSILVTSPRPGDGKTTTSTNLAVAFATAGERTILVDMDLRRPRMHKFFPCDNSVGVSSVLAGGDLNAAVQALPTVPGLWLLPAGPVRDDASELLSDEQVELLVSQLAQRFDTVIIDSAPVLAVSDALAITRACDGVLLVTSAGSTDRRQARDATDQLADVQAPVLGAVLNNFSAKESGYTYSYSYGDYGSERTDDSDEHAIPSGSKKDAKKKSKQDKKAAKGSKRSGRKRGEQDAPAVVGATGLPDVIDSTAGVRPMPDGSIPTPEVARLDVVEVVEPDAQELRLSFDSNGDGAGSDDETQIAIEPTQADPTAPIGDVDATVIEVDEPVVAAENAFVSDQTAPDGAAPAASPASVATEVPVETTIEPAVDAPVDVPVEVPAQVPADVPDNLPVDVPMEPATVSEASVVVDGGAEADSAAQTGRRGVFVTLDIPLTGRDADPAAAAAATPAETSVGAPAGDGVAQVRDEVIAARAALQNAETLATEQAALARAVQRAAHARDEAERVAAEYTEMARAAAERAAQALAAAEEAAADHALAEQLAAERRATEQSALANAAAEQASSAQMAAERAALDLTDAERTVADHLAVARLAREAALDRAASARAAAERVARSQHLSVDELLRGDGDDAGLPLPPLSTTGADTAPLQTDDLSGSEMTSALDRALTDEERLIAVRAELRQARLDHHAERRLGIERGIIASTTGDVPIVGDADDTTGLDRDADQYDDVDEYEEYDEVDEDDVEEYDEDVDEYDEVEEYDEDDDELEYEDEYDEPSPKKAPAKRPAAKKATKRSPAKKAPAKKTTAKKATKKSTAKKATAKKATAKKASAKKSTAKKSTAKKSASSRSARTSRQL